MSASSDASSVAPAVVKGNRKGPIMISSDEEDNENTGKEQYVNQLSLFPEILLY